MIAFIASLLGLGSGAGLSARAGSVNGPSVCPLCSERSAVAPEIGPLPKHLSARSETAMSLLRTYSDAGKCFDVRCSPTNGAQR
jgi:hypothetical protein